MFRAGAGTLILVVLPGLLVASILRFRLRVLLTWAAIPVFSLASVFLLGEVTAFARVPFGVPTFTAFLLLLVGALIFVRTRDSARRRCQVERARTVPAATDARLADACASGLLVLGVAIGVFIWLRGLRGVPFIPPGSDAARHGWMVARILYGQTTAPSEVLTYDAGGAHQAFHYYPTALHASAALSTRIVGGDVAHVLVAYLVLFSAVVLPVGMFVLARTLSPTQPLVAGFTALVVPLLVVFPYSPVWYGDIPQIVAMALVPVAVVLLLRPMLARRPPTLLNAPFVVALIPSALAIVCITAVHSSELPVVVFLALLLVLERAWRKRNPRMLPPALLRGAAAGLLAVALFAPTLVAFAGGVSERTSVRAFTAPDSRNWEIALGRILELHYGAEGTVRQGFLALLALAGVALCLLWRRPAWVAGWAGVVLLTLFSSATTNGVTDFLTLPWYHQFARINVNVAFFVPFFAAVTLAYGVLLIARLTRRSWTILPTTLAMVAVLAIFTGVHAARVAGDFVHTSFSPGTRFSPVLESQAAVDSDSLAAFAWLRAHVAKDDTVANEPFVDGSLWMYAQSHVAPLVGMYEGLATKLPPDLADRVYLSRSVQRLGQDRRATLLARRYRTRWIYHDERSFGVFSRAAIRRVPLAELMQNPNLGLVFHQGSAFVFEVNLAS